MGERGKRFLWNVGTSFVARATVKLISFIVTIFIINHLGKEQFGLYAIVLNFSMIWMVLMDFGWVDMMVREISRQPEQTKKLFSTYLMAQLGLNIFAIILFLVIIVFSGYDLSVRHLLLIITIGLFLFGFTRPFHSVLVVHEALDRIAFLSFFSSFITAIVLLAGVITRQPLPYFVWGFNIFIILQCFFYFLYARDKIRPGKFSPDLSLLKPILLMSLPFTAVLVLAVLLRQLDVILLSKFKSTADCGIYASASKFVFPFLMFSESVHLSVFPILSREEAANPEAFQRALAKTGKYLLAIGLYLAVLIFMLAPEIINTLLKPEYRPAINVLRILVWSLPLLFISRLLFYALVSLNRMRFLIITHLYVLCVFIGVSIVFISINSYLGAAMAVVFINWVLFIFLWRVPIQAKILSFRIESLPSLALTLVLMLVTLIVSKQLLLAQPAYFRLLACGSAGTMIFLTMLFASGFIGVDERRQIFSFFSLRLSL